MNQEHRDGYSTWYYEELARVYRKRKDYVSEFVFLQGPAKHMNEPEVGGEELLARLEKTWQLVEKSLDHLEPVTIWGWSKWREVLSDEDIRFINRQKTVQRSPPSKG